MLPTVSKDQVRDHTNNLVVHDSMGSQEMHPRVLMELADVVAEPLPMILEKSGEVPGDWKKGNIVPIFKKVEGRILGTTSLSASSLGKSWSRSS